MKPAIAWISLALAVAGGAFSLAASEASGLAGSTRLFDQLRRPQIDRVPSLDERLQQLEALAAQGLVDEAVAQIEAIAGERSYSPPEAARLRWARARARMLGPRPGLALDDLKAARAAFDRDPRVSALIYTDLAAVYRKTRAFPAARAALDEALRRAGDRLLSPEDRLDLTTGARLFLCSLEFDVNRTVAALQECGEVIKEAPVLRATNPQRLAAAYGNLGVVYDRLGRFGEAKTAYREQLAALDLVPDSAISPGRAQALFNRGVANRHLFALEEAEGDLQQSLEIAQAFYRQVDHPNIVKVKEELAVVALSRGDMPRASALQREALAGRLTRPADLPDREAVEHLNTDCAILMRLGEVPDATACFEKVLSMALRENPHSVPRVTRYRINYANGLLASHRFADARRQVDLAVEARGGTQTGDTVGVASLLSLSAQLSWASGDVARATREFEQASDSWDGALSAALIASGQEEQRIGIVDQASRCQARLISFASTSDSLRQTLTPVIARSVLRKKARTIDATVGIRSLIRSRLAPASEERLAALEARIRDSGLQQDAGQLAALRRAESELWLELGASVGVRALDVPDVASLQTRLREFDDALIEIVQYQPSMPQQLDRPGGRYAAVILRGDGQPVVKWLGEVAVIDDLARRWLNAIEAGNDDAATGEALFKILWSPLEDALPTSGTVHVAADGTLASVPLAALPDGGPSGGGGAVHRLIDSYTVNTITSGRDLLVPVRPFPSRATVAIIAPDYNLGVARPTRTFPNLEPATIETPSLTATLVRGTDASRASIFTRQAMSDVLHFEAHGVYDPPGRDVTPDRFEVYRMALGSTGVALSGANVAAPERRQHILTAFDLSLLRLENVRLVFVASCGTAQGQATNGHGLLGFRRAIALAGAAESVLATMNVPQGATLKLVRAFYDEWGRGVGSAKALRRAQLRVRGDPNFSRPQFWAGFVAGGGAR